MPLTKLTPCLCVLALGPLAMTSHAQVIFADNFESDTVGANPANWDSVGSQVTVEDQTTVGTPFLTPTKFADFNDTSTAGLSLFKNTTAIDGILSTFSFDYYEPASTGSASVSIGYTGSGDINSSAAFRMTLDDGNIGFASGEVTAGTKSYSLDTPYRFYLVVNDTLGSVGYTGPAGSSETLLVGEFDAYFQELGTDTVTYAGTGVVDTADSLSRLGFRTFSTGDQVFYLDNVSIEQGGVIPEPSTYALIGGALALVLAGVYRRKSA